MTNSQGRENVCIITGIDVKSNSEDNQVIGSKKMCRGRGGVGVGGLNDAMWKICAAFKL